MSDAEHSDEVGEATETRDESIDAPAPLPDTTHGTPPKPRRDDLGKQITTIRTLLRKTQRAWITPLMLEGLAWYVVTLLASVLTAMLAAALFPSLAEVLPTIILAVGAILATIGAIVGAIVGRRALGDELDMARTLQAHARSFRDDLVSALKFADAIQLETFDTQNTSEALARLHIKRTADKVMEQARDGHLAHLLPSRDWRPAASALAGGLVLVALPLLIAPAWVSENLTGTVQKAMDARPVEPEKRAIISNLKLTIDPPSYTEIPSSFEPFTTGNIEVVTGSTIKLDAYSLFATVAELELIIEGSEGPAAQRVELSRSGRVKAAIVATEPSNYWFRAIMEDGRVIESSTKRKIHVIKDKAPTIEILSHSGEVEVSTRDVLELEFSVQDDFGATAVSRVHIFSTSDEGDEQRQLLDLPELQSTPRDYQGKHTLDLELLGLQPKDRVTLFFEATDNNTLTGPSVGRSEPLMLYVSSPDDKHIKNVEEQREVVEELLGSLADYLEAPVGERSVSRQGDWLQRVPGGLEAGDREARRKKLLDAHINGGKVLERMGKLAERLKEDPLMVQRDLNMFASLHKQLEALHKRGARTFERTSPAVRGELTTRHLQQLGDWSARNEAALEKGILRLEDLLFAQQMANVEATTQEIKELRERLKELLQKYKETKDPELKKAIKREIQRLRQRMQELMQRMRSQMKELPAEHVNREALEQARLESDSKQISDDFQKIEDLLDKDDIDGALEALEHMGEQLDKMTGEMSQQFKGAQPQGLNEFDEKMSELMDSVNDLSQLQDTVEQETREYQKERREEQQAETEELLEQATRQLLDQVREQKKELERLDKKSMPSHIRQNLEKAQQDLEQMEKSLQQQDVESSLDKAKQSLDEIENMRFSMQLSQRYLKRNSEKAKQMREAMSESREVARRGQQMVEQLEELMEQAQQQAMEPDPRAEQLAEQQRQVEQQAGELEQKIDDAAKQFPSLEQELKPSMQRARQAMQQAQEGLEQQRPQRALDSERQAIEELRQLKQQMKDSVQRQRNQERDGGAQESKDDQVELPQKSNARGSGYHDAIKKTMKEDRLDDYSSEIEQYYKSLVD